MDLLKEKTITAVTVKEICELADINRSTFYSHYFDQYDLLSKISEEVVADMYETLNEYSFKKNEEALQMTEKIMEYVAEKSDICQILLSDNGDSTFKKRVIHLTKNFIMEKWIDEHQLEGELSEYIPLLVVSGAIDAIESWLKNGMNESPQEMATVIHHFTNYGLSGFSK
ncbi:AcrR family transcriptional regulator [Alkalihalobacillus xiaoxiensis]|uniref:AcrR family transcriptional regulator n=1 Tax=Shouchella xiaoxiensis TaxID=766895 RepID=A0ABS2SVR8_9BACI|nr:TetR-like C-terminal domain-containing protein [Shouchella xiaoxiensis]MBM7839633.1 AcrR family transcriptional regulator [Shouchella xiaoxiensis]